jgi:dolichol-phosphate mannosyltransferase
MSTPSLTTTVVVLPTYNEIENFLSIATEILSLSPSIRLLVVDDASPDGTGEEAERLAASSKRVTVIRRGGKLGLGSAYRQAFQMILKDTDADLICQMDADFSHRPADLLKMIEAARSGKGDVVVGSRYIPDACIRNWSRRRIWLSRFGNFYTRLITGLPQSDVTGGLKCWRRKTLESIDLDALTTDGYGFQIEMSWNAWRLGYSIHEVAITFAERTQGVSKMDWPIVWEAMLLPWKLRKRQIVAPLHDS